jgi:hypothetical protein
MDFRKRQTAAASPAKPEDLLDWFKNRFPEKIMLKLGLASGSSSS